MKKILSILIAVALVMLLFPVNAFAAGASFSISGPSILNKGEIGTYTVKVKVSNAAVAEATLKWDSSFFEYVSGYKSGVWDGGGNKSGTYTLEGLSVKLRCIGEVGSSGKLSLSGRIASRLTTDSVNPSKSVSVSGGTKTVKNIIVTPPPPTEWELAEQDVKKMQASGALSLDIKENKQMPVSLLAALKAKKGSLTLNFGSYSCTIDGASLFDLPDADAIDLSLSFNKDETLSAAVGGGDAYQLHFGYHGEFPNKFTFTFKAEGSSPGDILYLYYYYSSPGITEGIDLAVVDENGYVSFSIYHCSSYFASKSIIEGAEGIDFESAGSIAQAEADAEAARQQSAGLETQLSEAQQQISSLEAQLESDQAGQGDQANPSTNEESGISVSILTMCALLLGAIVLSVLLTMLIGGIGIFKRRRQDYMSQR